MSRRNKELSMRKIREILRLSMCCGLGNREVARSCGVSHTVVNRHIARARGAGLSYQQIEGIDDSELKRLLKGKRHLRSRSVRPLPDWGWKDQALNELFTSIHVASSMALLSLIILHILGALHHGMTAEESVLRRMLPLTNNKLQATSHKQQVTSNK